MCWIYMYVLLRHKQWERDRGGTSPGPNLLPRIDGVRLHYQHTHTPSLTEKARARRRRNRAKVRPPAGTVFACFFRNRTPGALSLWIVDSRLRIAELQRYNRDTRGWIGNEANPDSAHFTFAHEERRIKPPKRIEPTNHQQRNITSSILLLLGVKFMLA